jgi:hypothetical protein
VTTSEDHAVAVGRGAAAQRWSRVCEELDPIRDSATVTAPRVSYGQLVGRRTAILIAGRSKLARRSSRQVYEKAMLHQGDGALAMH